MQACILDLSIPVSRASASKSSLLIPSLQLGYFHSRCEDLGSMADYFACMVQHYLPHLPELQKQLNSVCDRNWNTVYQSRDQNLLKINFKPDGRDWECFRHAAAACGVSICFLFVFLMSLEATGFFEKILSRPLLGWSSPTNSDLSGEKFEKFSNFNRKLDRRRGVLHRRLQLR